jgi:hypothetical protein
MVSNSKSGRKTGINPGVMLAATVVFLALPSAVLAFSSRFEPKIVTAPANGDSQTVQSTPMAARLAPALPVRSLGKGQMFQFTPAGNANRPDRSVTVAVRVDPQTVRAITVRGAKVVADSAPGAAPLQIAPTAFSLGVSRGYKSFAQNLVTPSETQKNEPVELGKLTGLTAAEDGPPRFNPKIVLDQKQPPGRAPRTFADSEDVVDLGGAYSLTRNFDVTAGVRYSQERDRLRPLTDGKKDSQAVYLGTQFRF